MPAALPPLWSLRWELLFSAALPVYVWIARRCRSPIAAALMAVACFVAVAAGTATRNELVEFMPMFMLGALLNGAASVEAANSEPTPGKNMCAIGSLLLLCVEWYARGLTSNITYLGIARVLSLAGAVGTVYYSTSCPAMCRILSHNAVLWVGRRSFSLYLVHFPIVVAAALLSGGQNLLLTIMVGVPASLLVADLFFRSVELPSRRLADFAKRLA